MNNNVIDYAYAFDLNVHDILSYTNNSYFCLLEKLRLLTYTEKQIIIQYKKDKIYEVYIDNTLYYEGEMKDGKFDGQGMMWQKNLAGKIYKRLEGKFSGGHFIEGVRHEEHEVDHKFFDMQFTRINIRVRGQVYGKDGKKLADGNYDESGNPQEGFFTLFDDNGKLKYVGNIKDGKYHGKGIFYRINTFKEGIWDNERFIEGIEYNVKVADSDGYDYYAEQAWIERKIKELDLTPREVEEELNDGGWTEFASIRHKDGERRIIQDTRKKEYEY